MFRQLARRVSGSLQLSRKLTAASESNVFVFPRQVEGNNAAVNWSLVEDGVTCTGAALRNAKAQQIQNKLKSAARKELFEGAFSLEEAGDQIEHAAFDNLLADAQNVLSDAPELLVEDGFLGAHRESRTGVRLITRNAAAVAFLRKMLIPTAEVEVNPKARYDGWNQSGADNFEWDGTKYVNASQAPKKGQRPIVVYQGQAGSKVALQFIQLADQIVGANIVVGDDTPLKAISDSIAYAASVINNAASSAFLHLPCATIFDGSNAHFLVNADDQLLASLFEKKMLYSPYYSAVSNNGVTALFNSFGRVASDETSDKFAIEPDNLVPLPSQFLVVSKDSGDVNSTKLAELMQSVVDEKSKPVLDNLLTKTKIRSVKNFDEIMSALK